LQQEAAGSCPHLNNGSALQHLQQWWWQQQQQQ
jgi:hypothetical protein